MVLGSTAVLSKADQRRLQLQLHWNRETSKVKDAAGLETRRKRVQQLKDAAELKRTRSKARELGLATDEVLRLRKVFNEVDDDSSNEINLEELQKLCQTVQGGRLAHLSKWDLQQFMAEFDDDNSGTLGFDEFLQLVSPRREQYRARKNAMTNRHHVRAEQNWMRMKESRTRYAWNLYNQYQDQVAKFGRKQGYTEERLQQQVKAFEEVDEDGSGEMELDELMELLRSLGKNNISRDEAQIMMQPFDWRRVGRIDLMGFLEMMSPRRKKNETRKKKEKVRMEEALQRQRTLSERAPQARKSLEQRHADASLRRWTRKLGYKNNEVVTIQRQFDSVDTDGSGEIDLDELILMLSTSSVVPEHLRRASREEVAKLLDEYDSDKSATIDFREFLHLVSPRRKNHFHQEKARENVRLQKSEIKNLTFNNARYRAAMTSWNKHLHRLWKHGRNMGFEDHEITALKEEFDKYDEDGSGDIDLKELSAIVRGPALGRYELTREDLKIMMSEFDYNKSGTITFAGFLEMMSPRRERARQKYMHDLMEIKERAKRTCGLSSGHSIIFKGGAARTPRIPRPPPSGRGSSKIGGRRSRAANQGGRMTPRISKSRGGGFGMSGISNSGDPEMTQWIEHSKGASPRGRPPSTLGQTSSMKFPEVR